jgi:adenylyltransferase/sulfurtransferase
MPFSPEESQRYARHLGLAGFGPAAQEKLRAASVLVIGAGGLGCPALLYLVAAGVGRITLIDSDRIELSNLQRQILFTTADLGLPKATAAAARLRALNPLITIEPHCVRFTRDNALAFVRAHDVVLDGTDNFPTRYLVNDACVLANRPFIYGAIQGFEGQVSVFNHVGGPTYRCLFPEPPPPGAAPNCAEGGVLGILPGIIGTLQATETIKLLTGLGEPLSGRLLLYDALAATTRTLRLSPVSPRPVVTDLPPEGYGELCTTPPALHPDEITAAALRSALAAGTPLQLIDVREAWERDLGAILPSFHVPLDIVATADLSALDPALPTVLFCAGGKRSLKALALLRSRLSFSSLLSLQGGYQNWVK